MLAGINGGEHVKRSGFPAFFAGQFLDSIRFAHGILTLLKEMLAENTKPRFAKFRLCVQDMP